MAILILPIRKESKKMLCQERNKLIEIRKLAISCLSDYLTVSQIIDMILCCVC